MLEKIYGQMSDLRKMDTYYTDYPVYGFDTETPDYTIRLLPISNGVRTVLYDVNKSNILSCFLDHFRKINNDVMIVFAHNLQFDFTVLMNQDLEDPYNMQLLGQKCRWRFEDCVINFFNKHPYFGSIKYDNGKLVELRDTFAFFGRVKLSELAESLKIGNKIKIDTDDFFDKNIYKKKLFREYAKEDSRLTALIGNKVMEYHAIEDVSSCVSAPQMSVKVLRKKFVTADDSLIQPDEKAIHPFELSYHGGKNGVYVLHPHEYKDVRLYDINSAYPYAMTQIPNFNHASFRRENDIKFPIDSMEGVYLISGNSSCPYNSTFSHDFKPLKRLRNIWITSYELRSLIEHGCIHNLVLHERIIIIPKTGLKNPLADYAEHYYKLKSDTAKDNPMYLYYKIGALNSLYGKFIERRYEDDKEYSTRGPVYNPAIASLITGHARAYLHDLEHKGKSLHSATDSVFTESSMETSKGLGGLSLEGEGNLKLFRCKFYVFINDKGTVIKRAMHGFHGRIEQALDIWDKRGKPSSYYEYSKMPTPGEAYLRKKLKLKMFGMNDMRAQINLQWDNIDYEQKLLF